MDETSTTENTESEEKKEVVQPQQEAENKEESQEDPVERNWKAVREKKKEDERLKKEQARKIAEQQEMIKAMSELLQKQSSPQQSYQQAPQQQSTEIHDEEWITGKQLKEIREQERREREEEKKRYEEQQKKYEQEKKQAEFIARIQREMPDYQTVLSEDNLAYLEYHAPQEAEALKHISDPYYQTLEAYNKVKRIVPAVSDLDKQKMERAKTTPNSVAQASNGYATNPNQSSSRRVSQQRKAELWAEARAAAKG